MPTSPLRRKYLRKLMEGEARFSRAKSLRQQVTASKACSGTVIYPSTGSGTRYLNSDEFDR